MAGFVAQDWLIREGLLSWVFSTAGFLTLDRVDRFGRGGGGRTRADRAQGSNLNNRLSHLCVFL
jgi:hypothetical protein